MKQPAKPLVTTLLVFLLILSVAVPLKFAEGIQPITDMYTSDETGNQTDVFLDNEVIYVTVPAEGQLVSFYVVDETDWSYEHGNLDDVSGGAETVTLQSSGPQTIALWNNPALGMYCIVLDTNNNGVFDDDETLYCTIQVLSSLDSVIIQGKVTDSSTGLPIENAFVNLFDIEGGTQYDNGVTDANGNYKLRYTGEALSLSTMAVAVNVASYSSKQEIVSAYIGSRTTQDFSLEHMPVSLSIHVTNMDFISIPYANLDIQTLGMQAYGLCTDGDGFYTGNFWIDEFPLEIHIFADSYTEKIVLVDFTPHSNELTLNILLSQTPDQLIASDANGAKKTYFYPSETMYATFSFYEDPGTLCIVNHNSLSNGDELEDVRTSIDQLSVISPYLVVNGYEYTTVQLWDDSVEGDYDIIWDVDGNGHFDSSADIIAQSVRVLPTNDYSVLQGTVTDSITGLGIMGCNIRLPDQASGLSSLSTATRADGSYKIVYIGPERPISMLVFATGYSSDSSYTTLRNTEPLTFDFCLNPEQILTYIFSVNDNWTFISAHMNIQTATGTVLAGVSTNQYFHYMDYFNLEDFPLNVHAYTSGYNDANVIINAPTDGSNMLNYYITLTQTTQRTIHFMSLGATQAPTVTYNINSEPMQTMTAPFDLIVNLDDVVTYSYQATVIGSSAQYLLTSVNPESPLTISDDQTIIGHYKSQVETYNGGNVQFQAPAGTITEFTSIDPNTLPDEGKPEVMFPDGLFAYTINDLTPSESVTLEITLSTDVPIGSLYWKYQNGNWYSMPIGSDNGDKVITLTLTDGGDGDADGIANGVIVDPGGVGINPASPFPVPESPLGSLMALFSCFAAIIAFTVQRRKIAKIIP